MSTETDQHSLEPPEQQLCTSCAAPNDPSANFCVKCGAPLSSFSMIAPFERLFAEGFIYRQAATHPRRFITVLGVWILFGALALGGLIIIYLPFSGVNNNHWVAIIVALFGATLLAISVLMIWKTTRNYFNRSPADERPED